MRRSDFTLLMIKTSRKSERFPRGSSSFPRAWSLEANTEQHDETETSLRKYGTATSHSPQWPRGAQKRKHPTISHRRKCTLMTCPRTRTKVGRLYRIGLVSKGAKASSRTDFSNASRVAGVSWLHWPQIQNTCKAITKALSQG